ncbi:hypothetical protein MBLNU230_g7488t1 [Neophaeotheca triangularis]
MASRLGFRAAQQSFRQSTQQFRLGAQRRWQSQQATGTVENAAGTGVPPEAGKPQSAVMAYLTGPVGPKTVHFWAPVMKWGLVIAGAADFARPASQLSITQNMALMATGCIWTRWCFVIKPRNLFLASVNFLLFCVGTTQVTRVLMWRKSQDNESLGEEIADVAKEQGKVLENVVEHPEKALNKVQKP